MSAGKLVVVVFGFVLWVLWGLFCVILDIIVIWNWVVGADMVGCIVWSWRRALDRRLAVSWVWRWPPGGLTSVFFRYLECIFFIFIDFCSFKKSGSLY